MNSFIWECFFFIIIANTIGYLIIRRKESIYLAALAVFCSAILVGVAGNLLTIGIHDSYQYMIMIGGILVFNSVILLLFALSISVVKNL